MFDKVWKITIAAALVVVAGALGASQWSAYQERRTRELAAERVLDLMGRVTQQPPQTQHSVASVSTDQKVGAYDSNGLERLIETTTQKAGE